MSYTTAGWLTGGDAAQPSGVGCGVVIRRVEGKIALSMVCAVNNTERHNHRLALGRREATRVLAKAFVGVLPALDSGHSLTGTSMM